MTACQVCAWAADFEVASNNPTIVARLLSVSVYTGPPLSRLSVDTSEMANLLSPTEPTRPQVWPVDIPK